MSEENRKDDPGTDPETQRQALIRRSKVAHPADEPPYTLNTTRPTRDGDNPPARVPDGPIEKQGG
ncbi:MAG: hypothetical protein QM820_38000 [Minicystis sp.]